MELLLWILIGAAVVIIYNLATLTLVCLFRRNLNQDHVHREPLILDPNSTNPVACPLVTGPPEKYFSQVPCPSLSDPAEKYLSLIIPAFNEELRLPGALLETMNYLQQRAERDKLFTYEVLIVNDGSSDRTGRVAHDFVKKYTVENIRAILFNDNHGKGEAVRKGMLHARGHLLLMLDADGETRVNDIEKLEKQIHAVANAVAQEEFARENSAAGSSARRVSDIPVAAFGSRAHLEAKALARRNWYRNFLMKGFHFAVSLTAGPGIRDTQCGFKMFTRAAARKIFTNIRLKGWCFDVEAVYLCRHFQIAMVEIPVTWSGIPGSRVSLSTSLYMLWEMVLISVGYRFGIWKIHP